MTYNYPYFSFPNFRRYSNYYPIQYPYTRQPNNINQQLKNYTNNKTIKTNSQFNCEKEKTQRNNSNYVNKKKENSNKKNTSGFNFLNNFLHQEDRGEDEEFFELLGLKLYQDDLLLIGLIFFLYKEDVKDQYLFFALILLLLS